MQNKKLFFLISSLFLVLVIFQSNLFQVLEFKFNRPTPFPQDVRQPQDHTIILLGDSMTERLGNSDELRAYLKEYYPNKTFEILNYGFGSTNILSVVDRLEKETFYHRAFRPILDIDFDLILFESFGYNPLSALPLEEGLKKQAESLSSAIRLIKEKNPKAKIVFVATIAPSKTKYGFSTVKLSSEKRAEWAKERMVYIENHIKFAKENEIPLINIYEKSLQGGTGNLLYISDKDYIHPSPTGVYFISKEMAKFIFDYGIY